MENQILPRDSKGKLESYAWPGGYPILYYYEDGDSICPDCANKTEERIAGWFIHYEGSPETCVECNKHIESAYGETAEDKNS